MKRSFTGIVSLLCIARLASAFAAAPDATSIRVNVDEIYYQLPRWAVGAKMTAYASDYAGGNVSTDPRRAARTTPDGKTWLTCISEMKLGFIGGSMTRQGRPPNKGKPYPHYDDWRVAANAVVEAGGGVIPAQSTQ